MKKGKYYLHSEVANDILTAIVNGKSHVNVSVDLNKNICTLEINGDRVFFDMRNRLDRNELCGISSRANRVFVLENNKLRILEYRDYRYYKLVPTEHAPTVEIDGVKMHRSKDIDPFENARLTAKEVVRNGDRVLDTCGGLGYTAIWAARVGASKIVSVECSEFISHLRKENPWSDELFVGGIQLVNGDISQHIYSLESASHDSIIHDPPRFSLAGELYSESFYRQLHRILVKGGRLFHYTGNPYSARRGNTFIVNTAKRLTAAGFKAVSIKQNLLGVKAIK